jgi:hypothetical protein
MVVRVDGHASFFAIFPHASDKKTEPFGCLSENASAVRCSLSQKHENIWNDTHNGCIFAMSKQRNNYYL